LHIFSRIQTFVRARDKQQFLDANEASLEFVRTSSLRRKHETIFFKISQQTSFDFIPAMELHTVKKITEKTEESCAHARALHARRWCFVDQTSRVLPVCRI